MKDSILKIKTIDGTIHELDIDQYFYGEYNNLKYKQNDLVLFPQEVNDGLFSYCLKKLGIEKNDVFEIEFPKSITKILPGTLKWFKNLRGIKFHGNIEEIGFNNFGYTVPDLKGIIFTDPDISNNLKSISFVKDNIPNDLKIFGGPNGKISYEQFLLDSKNRKAPEVKIEFKLNNQTEPIIIKSEFADSETFSKYGAVLTQKLFKKILGSHNFDFKSVNEIKISDAKTVQLLDLEIFPDLKKLELSEGTNYYMGAIWKSNNFSLILPNSLRLIVDPDGTVRNTTNFAQVPKYVVVNGNDVIRNFFKAQDLETIGMKVFDTKDDLEKYLNIVSPDKNIYSDDFSFKTGATGTLPFKTVNFEETYKPEVSYLKAFDAKTIVSLIFFVPLGICFFVYNICQIYKQNQEIKEENSITKNKTSHENKTGPITKLDMILKNKKTKPAFKSKSYTEKGYF